MTVVHDVLTAARDECFARARLAIEDANRYNELAVDAIEMSKQLISEGEELNDVLVQEQQPHITHISC